MKELLLCVVLVISLSAIIPAAIMVWLSVTDELKGRRK